MKIYWEPAMNRVREDKPCCDQWARQLTWNYRVEPNPWWRPKEERRPVLVQAPDFSREVDRCPGCGSLVEIIEVDEQTILALPRYLPEG